MRITASSSIESYAVDRVRAVLADPEALASETARLLGNAHDCRVSLQQELFVCLAPNADDLAALATMAQASYRVGGVYDAQIASWLREGGVSARDAWEILALAGTSAVELPGVLRHGGYQEREYDPFAERALDAELDADSASQNHAVDPLRLFPCDALNAMDV